jgi:small GTP-binding protein
MKPLGSPDSKVIFVGDPSVGKTSIIQQYHEQKFDAESEATIGASFVAKMVETRHGPVSIHIWDTAGQERYRSLIPMYSRNAIAAAVVFDVANAATYQHLDAWLATLREHCLPDCSVYVLANKSDLPAAVPIRDAEAFCAERKLPFFVTTATDYQTVAAVFERIAADIGQRGAKAGALTGSQPATAERPDGCC